MEVYINKPAQYRVSQIFIKRLFKLISRKLSRYKNSQVSIALVGNKEIRKLNKRYRSRDQATDVLSFSEIDTRVKFSPPGYLGEIVVSYPYIRSQAKKYKKPVREELALVLVHGFLHLIGYDHLNKKDEQKMRRQEKIILESFLRKNN